MTSAQEPFEIEAYRPQPSGIYLRPGAGAAPAAVVAEDQVEQQDDGQDHDGQDSVPDVGVGVQRSGSWFQQRAERLAAGETWSVRRRRHASAEAHRKAEIDDPAVTKAQATVVTAARREELAEDPRAEAYANRRARRLLMTMAGVGIALGVGISASSAQQTITHFMHWAANTLAYYAAYGADPALGLVLFATLGARILASARGVAVPERARAALNRIELVLFALVAVLNAGPSLGGLVSAVLHLRWAELGPDVMVLVIHALGPVLVASGVFGVPFMALILSEITAATNAKRRAQQVTDAVVGAGVSGGVTPPSYRENTPAVIAVSNPSREDEVTAEVLGLLASGEWSWPVSARTIQRRFGCGMDIARQVRDRVRQQLGLPEVASVTSTNQ